MYYLYKSLLIKRFGVTRSRAVNIVSILLRLNTNTPCTIEGWLIIIRKSLINIYINKTLTGDVGKELLDLETFGHIGELFRSVF